MPFQKFFVDLHSKKKNNMKKTKLECVETVKCGGEIQTMAGKTYNIVKDNKKETVIRNENNQLFVVDGQVNFMSSFIKK